MRATDGSNTSASDTFRITVANTNDAPTAGTGSTTVSEEGLTAGNPDIVGTSDTTNSTIAGGTIAVSDVDGNSLTVTLGDPGAVLTSGGQVVTWAGVGTHSLVGSVGGTPILTVTINNAGVYTVTLTGPIDHPNTSAEDIKTITLPVNVSDGITTTPTTLSVTIEDDSPKADLVAQSVVATAAKTNVMIILDLSGSMATGAAGLTGLSRLDVAKAAINELLEQYDNRGDVMVRLVTFADNGAEVGNIWTDLLPGQAVAGLGSGGATNYDAAIPAAMGAFTDANMLSGPGTRNVSYFLSDGAPSPGRASTPPKNRPFGNLPRQSRDAHQQPIISYALGIPDITTTTSRSYRLRSGGRTRRHAIIVTDLAQLASTLVFSMPPVNGGFVAGVNGGTVGSFGADGGFLQSITVDGVTYIFNPTTNTVTQH